MQTDAVITHFHDHGIRCAKDLYLNSSAIGQRVQPVFDRVLNERKQHHWRERHGQCFSWRVDGKVKARTQTNLQNFQIGAHQIKLRTQRRNAVTNLR